MVALLVQMPAVTIPRGSASLDKLMLDIFPARTCSTIGKQCIDSLLSLLLKNTSIPAVTNTTSLHGSVVRGMLRANHSKRFDDSFTL